MKGKSKKRAPKKKAGLSIRELHRITGADRASIKKWVPPGATQEEAIEIIEERKKRKSDANFDPDSGLTWFQAKQKEETLEKRRKNQVAEKTKNEEWMATAVHHQIITLIMGQLELLPGKAQSQLGLDARQTSELQRMVDDVRSEGAKQVENL